MRRLSPFSFFHSAAFLFNRIVIPSRQDQAVEKTDHTTHPAPAVRQALQSASKLWIGNLIQIYSCAAFFVYSTALLVFFYELASLLIRFSLVNILGFFSYQMVFALLESILVAVSTTVLVYLIPLQQVRSHRSAAGFLFLLAFAASSLLFRDKMQIVQRLYDTSGFTREHASEIMMFLWLFALIGFSFLALLIVKAEKFSSWIESILENLTVLAGVYTVLSVIGLLVVLYRNLL